MTDFDFTQLKGRMAQAGKGGHVELSDLERNALITNAIDGGSVDPEEVQELIDESLEGYYNKFEVDSELNTKSDKSTTYTKTEVDTSLNLKQNSSDIATINGSDITHGGNVVIEAVEGQTITVDPVPTSSSENPVQSGGVYDAISDIKVFVGEKKQLTFINAYVAKSTGKLTSSTASVTSQPFMLYAGESVTVSTANSNIGIICQANSGNQISVGDIVSVLESTSSSSTETHTYTADNNVWIVICFKASDGVYSFDSVSNIDELIKASSPSVESGIDSLTIADDTNNAIALFRNGHIRTKNFNSEAIATYVHEYISADYYNQIPIEKCNYEKPCHFPTGSVNKGKVSREYAIDTSIARVALFGDLHVGYGYSFADYNGLLWKNWEDYVELSFKRASNKAPDFGVALGDQLSSINSSIYNRNGVGLIERNDYYNRLRPFNYPLFNVFGNHDDALPDFIHKGVIEINNIRFIVFHMDIVYATPFSTYNISDDEYEWLEDAVIDSYNNGYITILVSHYPIIGDSWEGTTAPDNYIGHLLVNNHGQDLINLCKTYNVRLHIHGHVHPTGFPYIIMNDNGTPFDMTEVEIGLGARAYVILEIKNDGFHFTEYPLTRKTGAIVEDGVTISTYEVLDDEAGRTLFIPFYNQQAGTIISNAWTPYPNAES